MHGYVLRYIDALTFIVSENCDAAELCRIKSSESTRQCMIEVGEAQLVHTCTQVLWVRVCQSILVWPS